MAFVVIPDRETFRMVVDANQLERLVDLGRARLGLEIVLVEGLRDDLERDRELSAYIRDNTPPFEIIERGLPPHSMGPYPQTHVEVTNYLTGQAKERIDTGEDCILVVPNTGAWFWNRPPENVAIVCADENLVDRITQHLDNGIEVLPAAERVEALLRMLEEAPDVPPDAETG